MKVGLVLGGGGVMGGAWLTGGLEALVEETGWHPAQADVISGTSAGSMIGALVSAGLPLWFMTAHSRGESFDGMTDADGRPASEHDRSAGAIFRPQPGAWPRLPGSWRLAARSLVRPTRHTPLQVATGWLPRGVISTAPLERIVTAAIPGEWSPHPRFWAVACDYESGRRTVFGREDAPAAPIAKAVAASCAIPGFYRPVKIGGRSYVDGGIYSPSNLDLVREEGLDLVICLNPTSTLHPIRTFTPIGMVGRVWRGASGRRLGSEAKRLRARGAEVVLVQPTREDLDAMGPNLMSRAGRNRVIEVAKRTVREQLGEARNRELIAELDPGDPYLSEPPPGPPSDWPGLDEIARRVRERDLGPESAG